MQTVEETLAFAAIFAGCLATFDLLAWGFVVVVEFFRGVTR